MDGHFGVQIGFLIGTPVIGGLMLVAATWVVGESLASFRGTLLVVVGLFTLFIGTLAAVIERRRTTSAFESLRRQEEDLKRLRAEFVQNVTHELRHPLTLVRGYVELLTQGQLDEEERHHLSSVALARTIDLVERVEAITTFQEVPSGNMSPELVDVADLTETALKMVWQKAHRAGIALCMTRPPALPAVVGDPAWLLEALKQLLDNAIKFSPKGSVISVQVYPRVDQVCVEVADQGIGVSANQLERVSVPFCQADGSASRRFGGVGLGLAIVRAVAEAHGGRVRVASEGRDKGSTFTLTLPLSHKNSSDRLDMSYSSQGYLQ